MKPLPEDKRKYLRPSVSAVRRHSPPVCLCARLCPFLNICVCLVPFIIMLLITSTVIVYTGQAELICNKIKQHDNIDTVQYYHLFILLLNLLEQLLKQVGYMSFTECYHHAKKQTNMAMPLVQHPLCSITYVFSRLLLSPKLIT